MLSADVDHHCVLAFNHWFVRMSSCWNSVLFMYLFAVCRASRVSRFSSALSYSLSGMLTARTCTWQLSIMTWGTSATPYLSWSGITLLSNSCSRIEYSVACLGTHDQGSRVPDTDPAAARYDTNLSAIDELCVGIRRKDRRELKPAAARAEDILAGGLLNLAPLAGASAADISAALVSKGIRMQQVDYTLTIQQWPCPVFTQLP